MNIERISDIRIYKGSNLWEYIADEAELYHDYNFIEVATADYKTGEVEFVADIYRFDTSLNAYGLYTHFRPPLPDILDLGVEGYKSPGSINFVKGQYLVRLTGYDESEQTALALNATAQSIEKLVLGTNEYPELFKRFYFVDKIKYTDKYLAKSFIGRKYLTAVYTQDYLIKSDTATFFLSDDATGEKFAGWIEDLKDDTTFFQLPPGLLTVNGQCFKYRDSLYKNIITLYDNGLIYGILDVQFEHKDIIISWVMSMPGFNAESTMVKTKRIIDSVDN